MHDMTNDRIKVVRDSIAGRRKGFRWRLMRGRLRWTVDHTREVQSVADDLDKYFQWLLDELDGKSHDPFAHPDHGTAPAPPTYLYASHRIS